MQLTTISNAFHLFLYSRRRRRWPQQAMRACVYTQCDSMNHSRHHPLRFLFLVVLFVVFPTLLLDGGGVVVTELRVLYLKLQGQEPRVKGTRSSRLSGCRLGRCVCPLRLFGTGSKTAISSISWRAPPAASSVDTSS